MKPSNQHLPVLEFWRDLEIFSIPSAPGGKNNTERTEIITLRPQERLPWEEERFQSTERFGFFHSVYIGVADLAALTRLVLQAVFPGQDLSEREFERASGRGWLASFIVTENGCPKPDSYLPASVIHGTSALRESGSLENINSRLERARGEFSERCYKLTDGAPVHSWGWSELNNELRIVRKLLGVRSDTNIDWRVVVQVSRVNRSYLEDSLQTAADHLNSFYLDDLDRLITHVRNNTKPFGKALNSYLSAPIDEANRIDILENHATMGELVSVKSMPSARWPASSVQPLALAQQAAVAHVLSDLSDNGGVIGVNGPPGTGKTTLLCDVIAEVITERARRIAELSRPSDLFDDAVQIGGKNFHPLKSAVIAGSSIVVTSTNNNAVKNITQELPARKKVSDEFGRVDYFGEVVREVFAAQKVSDDNKQSVEVWGLMAAALGNADNRRSFAKGFFRDEPAKKPAGAGNASGASDARPPSIKQLLEEAHENYQYYQSEWQKAKKTFQAMLSDFNDRRAVLLQAENAALSIEDCRHRLQTQGLEAQNLIEAIEQTSQDIANQRELLGVQRVLAESRRATLAQLRAASPINLWDRIIGLFGGETGRMVAIRQSLARPITDLAMASESLFATAQKLESAEIRLKAQQEHLCVLRKDLQDVMCEHQNYECAINAGHDTGAKHFPDGRLWGLSDEERHRASVAVSPALDDLRARIFLQAMELHRLTVLANAVKFIVNLRAVNGMLTGGLKDKLLPEQRPMLWDTFFFVVPVVSTTLASFDKLFAGMGQESLGWLLVDEAGQATPQSAAGALWRSRRAVLIGDPLQIEPVFTVPLGLVEELRKRHGVSTMWSPTNESVQTLADRITRYGSWVGQGNTGTQGDQRIWTGMPLRTHRRCDDPMFSVANRIAYADQMVQGRVDSNGLPASLGFHCVLGDSTWFSVSATRSRHPVIDDELDVLMDCLIKLRDNPAHTLPDGKQAKVYVISPFRKVKSACELRIKKKNLHGVECGTVHTFQGKEAEVVFLVLGTAPDQEGAGARAWAASKPNLLNVAITRAKHRLYVIGDENQWRGLPNFGELREALLRHRSVS